MIFSMYRWLYLKKLQFFQKVITKFGQPLMTFKLLFFFKKSNIESVSQLSVLFSTYSYFSLMALLNHFKGKVSWILYLSSSIQISFSKDYDKITCKFHSPFFKALYFRSISSKSL